MTRSADLTSCNQQPTVAARLTPAGRAAVAVLAVAGPQAISAVESHFHPARNQPLRTLAVGQIVFGHWGGPAGEEVVVCRLENEHEKEHIEVHCHGGQQAAKRILDELVAAGCQAVDWQEWIDPHATGSLEADAHKALTRALTRRGAAILLDQYQGALRRELAAIRDCLVNQGQVNLETKAALPRIERLLHRSDVGLHLSEPWQVLIAGRPNVGKSSLVNAILGYRRAIVFDQPGTTRDVLSANTAMGGWPVRLSDTAGMHHAADGLESRGIKLAYDQLRTNDLLVWVLDASAIRDSTQSPNQCAREEMATSLGQLSREIPVLVVLNKIDLKKKGVRNHLCEAPSGPFRQMVPDTFFFPTCAITSEGVDVLVEGIAHGLVPQPPVPGDAVPFHARHQRLLHSAKDALQAGDQHSATSRIDELLHCNC